MIAKLKAEYAKLIAAWNDYIEMIQRFENYELQPGYDQVSGSLKNKVNSYLGGFNSIYQYISGVFSKAEGLIGFDNLGFAVTTTIIAVSAAFAATAGAAAYLSSNVRKMKELDYQIQAEMGTLERIVHTATTTGAKAATGIGMATFSIAIIVGLIFFRKRGK